MLQQGTLVGGVVGTLMTNLGLEVALTKLDIPLVRAKVGDRYVMELLQEKGWRLGGENSGHIICLDQTTTGDGIIASLQVLKAASRANKTLFELRKEIKKFPQILINVRFSGEHDPLSSVEVQQSVREVEQALGKTGRVLLRKSGTEPLIRVMVEGENEAEVKSFAEKIAAQVTAAK
jgi:phosphoglucosamine mutase